LTEKLIDFESIRAPPSEGMELCTLRHTFSRVAPPPTYPDSITHSLLFNHNYLYMDALATNIITWMWGKFGKHCTNPSLRRLHSPPQNFDSKVIGLLHKLSYYHYLLPMTKPKRVVLPIH
jgi:hypothetical protein